MKDLKKFCDFNGSWEKYLQYLDQNNALSPNITRDIRANSYEPETERGKFIPWKDMTKEQQQNHIGYLKTLKPPYSDIYKRMLEIPEELLTKGEEK